MRHWPLLDLRLTTPRLELRLPAYDDLDGLADRALEGVHDPDSMPFLMPWTDAPKAEIPVSLVQYHLGVLSRWRPDDWTCNFVVLHEGTVIGTQGISGKQFAVTREVSTGSWLGKAFQGRGFGTEMRAAVLHFAFEGLGAEWATSAAFVDNAPSLAVSRRLGYREDGMEIDAVRGERVEQARLRLSRGDFENPVPVDIQALIPTLPSFGL